MGKYKYLFREWALVVCLSLHQTSFGLILSLPAVVAPTLAEDGSDVRGSDEDASWFMATFGFMLPISLIVMSVLMQRYGRKPAHILSSGLMCAGSVTMALATNITHLIIGRVLHGLAFGGVIVSCVIIGENVHQRRRGFFSVFKCSFTNVGLLMGHSLGLKAGWRLLAWLTGVPAALSAIGILLWPDTPAWFAYKERFEECVVAFEYFRGKDSDSKKELKHLMFTQKNRQLTMCDYGTSPAAVVKAFKSKDFWKILGIETALKSLYHSFGCNYIVAFLSHIMLRVTDDASVAYYYIVASDISFMITGLISSVVVRAFNRKCTLLWSGGGACSILSLTIVIYYFKTIGVTVAKPLLPILILLYYSLCTVGVFSVILSYQCELFPLNYRGMGICYSGFILGLADSLTSKFTAGMLKRFDLHGTFGIYLCWSVFFMIVLYFILPETKDKTLQEIENNLVELKLMSMTEIGNNDDFVEKDNELNLRLTLKN